MPVTIYYFSSKLWALQLCVTVSPIILFILLYWIGLNRREGETGLPTAQNRIPSRGRTSACAPTGRRMLVSLRLWLDTFDEMLDTSAFLLDSFPDVGHFESLVGHFRRNVGKNWFNGYLLKACHWRNVLLEVAFHLRVWKNAGSGC